MAMSRDSSKASVQQKKDEGESPGASSRSVQLRQQLAGMTFAQQQEALTPPADGVGSVQARGGGGQGDVHAAAAHGISGSGGALPYGDRIQAAFGHHDISNVQAHVGGKAAEGASAMGAEAYATGNSVAFGTSPSLHTAAHEAAHVVQQQSGVSLKGGVGQAGDGYEQHADRVADAVVAGQSASSILDEMTGGGPSGGAVQQKAVQRDGSGELWVAGIDIGTASTYDAGGGHSYKDHGAHTTKEQHVNRLNTGIAPSGRASRVPAGAPGSSKFNSDSQHEQALKKAAELLAAKNSGSGRKRGLNGKIGVAGGTIYTRANTEEDATDTHVDVQVVDGKYNINTAFPTK